MLIRRPASASPTARGALDDGVSGGRALSRSEDEHSALQLPTAVAPVRCMPSLQDKQGAMVIVLAEMEVGLLLQPPTVIGCEVVLLRVLATCEEGREIPPISQNIGRHRLNFHSNFTREWRRCDRGQCGCIRR